MSKKIRQMLAERMKNVRAEISKLKREVGAAERSLKALSLAEKLLVEENVQAAAPSAPTRRPRKRRIRRDKRGPERTAKFLLERGRATTIGQVSREFRISRDAATQRLRLLVQEKRAVRLGRGVYGPPPAR